MRPKADFDALENMISTIIKVMLCRSISIALALLCATPVWSLSPARFDIAAEFTSGTSELLAGEEARLEEWAAAVGHWFENPKCVLDASVYSFAEDSADVIQYSLAQERGTVLKDTLKRGGLRRATFIGTQVAQANSIGRKNTARFMFGIKPDCS